MQYRRIIGNENYSINENKEILCLEKNQRHLEEQDGFVNISLFGEQKKWRSKEWLLLVAYYNLIPPKGYENCIKYLDFVKIPYSYNGLLDKHLVLFSKPIYHKEKEGFRMIARYPNYFINKNGEIYNNKIKDFIKVKNPSRGYPKVSLSDQSGIKLYASCTVDRLVDTTWIWHI